MLVAFTLITGLLYPLGIWIVTHDLFAYEAEGSLLRRGNVVVGSSHIGQSFTEPRYLWGRLSAVGNDPKVSSGSNLGPLNPKLLEASKARIEALRAADSTTTTPVPVDLVTASASGLDPDISPAAARYQVGRIARARGTSPEAVRALIDRHVEGRTLFVLGEPRVNALAVNLDLDREFPARPLAGVVY
jgi:K+-transporting ATPase ATPase C chain